MKLLPTLSAILFFTFASIAYAAPVTSLYQATVPVQSESPDDLQRALPQAFAQVLIKVSGNPKILNASEIRHQFPQASSFVQSYSYVNNQDGSSELLQVQFDPKAINQLIVQSGGQLWSNQRPLTLIILAVQTPQGQTILSSQAANPLINILQNNAARRGLPILLPMMDIEDMQNISLAEVLNSDLSNVGKAAQRYDANGILEGRVYTIANDQWVAEWTFLFNQQSVQWKITGNDANQVIANTIDKLANTLVTQVANNENVAASFANQHVLLHITNVRGVQDFADLVKYLRGLTGVSAVNVMSVNPDNIDVDVIVAGGSTALTNDIKIGSRLQLATDNTASANIVGADSNSNSNSEDDKLTYQWIAENNNNNDTNNNNNNNPAPLSPS